MTESKTILIDPEKRTDKTGAYRYTSVALFKDEATRRRNQKKKGTVAVRAKGSGVDLHADVVIDFKCRYDFENQATRWVEESPGMFRLKRGGIVRHDEVEQPGFDASTIMTETFMRDVDSEINDCIHRFMRRSSDKNYRGDMRGTTLNLQVLAGDGDAHEKHNGSTFSSTSTACIIRSATSTTGRYVSGFHITGVSVPAGATINSAEMSGYCYHASLDSFLAHLAFQDVDNAVDFGTDADVYDRWGSATTAQVDLDATDVGIGWYTFPDTATALQEVIDRPGWAENNAVCALASGQNASTVSGYISSYDKNSSEAFKLDIDYTAGGAASSGPTMGMMAF